VSSPSIHPFFFFFFHSPLHVCFLTIFCFFFFFHSFNPDEEEADNGKKGKKGKKDDGKVDIKSTDKKKSGGKKCTI
jgi:hypothetical protein